MRSFEHPNMEGFVCPICKTSEDKPVTLIPVIGTDDGSKMVARQYHIDCIDLAEVKTHGMGLGTILVQKVMP